MWEIPLVVAAFASSNFIHRRGDALCCKYIPAYRTCSARQTAQGRADFVSRICSTVMSTVIFSLCALALILRPDMRDDPAASYHPAVEAAVCISIGYFMADALTVWQHKLDPFLPILAHHLLASGGFVFAVYWNFTGWFAATLLLMEVGIHSQQQGFHFFFSQCFE